MDVIRYGLIGTGLMGCEHARNLAALPGAVVTAVADPHGPSRHAVRAALGPDAAPPAEFASAGELLASGLVDAVVIATPNHTHLDTLRACFAHPGMHVLVEKPLCTTVDDAREAVRLAAAHRGVVWMGLEYRYMPPVARFLREVPATVGRLRMVAIREHRYPFLPKVGDWNRFSVNTGGTLVEKCCHFFDLMRHIVQAEPVRVFCSGGQDVNHLDEAYDGERPDILDNSYTVVDFDNGVRALLDLSMFADGSEEQEEICAVGDAAKLEVFIPSSDLVFSPRVGFGAPKRVERETISVDEAALRAGSHHGATYYQHRAFLAAILEGAPVQVTAFDGWMAVAMGAAAERSAREKRVVEMAEILAPARAYFNAAAG